MPVLKTFLLCGLLCGAAVGYVWQKNQIYELGNQCRAREATLGRLQNQNRKLRDLLAVQRSPQTLDQRVRALNLGLCLPQPNQVWHLVEPSRVPSAPVTNGAAPQWVSQAGRVPLGP